MRNFRLCVCLLVSGTLFILGGCHKGAVRSIVCDVTINGCAAVPLDVEVKEGGHVCWEARDVDYTIRFSDQGEPTPNPIPVKHGVPDPPHPIRGHSGCVKETGNPLHKGWWYCKYSVSRDNEPVPCADPGVHVTPP
jgi:hypothetical protein